LAAAGVAVTHLGRGGFVRSRLTAIVEEFRADLVQGWMYRGNLAASRAAGADPAAPPVVWSIRQGLNDLAKSPWTTRIVIARSARLSVKPYAIVYNAASAARAHEAIGFHPGKTRIVPNGIDVPAVPPDPVSRAGVRARLGLPDDAFVVALIARWHPVKNHEGFVAAAARFARERPEARFLLAGAGVDAKNATLGAWVRDAGIADRCLLLGERSDVSDLLAASDLATLASHGEAFPNALLEAMAAGVPCVAPAVGDIAEMIGPAGLIVPTDDPQALAAGWERIAASDPAARRAMGDAERARVAARFGLDEAATAFESLYREATGSASER
jgi:glycosyltransferase involved in cell wall biosynthesis